MRFSEWAIVTKLKDGCITAFWCGPENGWQELADNAIFYPSRKEAKAAMKAVLVPPVLFELKRSQLMVGVSEWESKA